MSEVSHGWLRRSVALSLAMLGGVCLLPAVGHAARAGSSVVDAGRQRRRQPRTSPLGSAISRHRDGRRASSVRRAARPSRSRSTRRSTPICAGVPVVHGAGGLPRRWGARVLAERSRRRRRASIAGSRRTAATPTTHRRRGACNDPSENSEVSVRRLRRRRRRRRRRRPPPPPPPPPPIAAASAGTATLVGNVTRRTGWRPRYPAHSSQACPTPQRTQPCRATQTDGAGHYAFVAIRPGRLPAHGQSAGRRHDAHAGDGGPRQRRRQGRRPCATSCSASPRRSRRQRGRQRDRLGRTACRWSTGRPRCAAARPPATPAA